jgi:ectoine hydroxylase-related dioxygenase (phytanoyl-CoA dioxygenase family)
MHLGPAVFRLLTNPRLLDVVEALIGPEIYSNPVQHVRIKPPEAVMPDGPKDSAVAATPWHQDQGVLTPDADESHILTVWIPITEATAENGCMLVIPGSHRDGLALHCSGTVTQPELHIPDADLRLHDAVPVPMRTGQVLLMNRRTNHASLGNRSDDIRWSFDLRYNPTGQPTGRSAFPGFVARSRSDAASVLSDPREWADRWYAARASLAMKARPVFNRWAGSPAACA